MNLINDAWIPAIRADGSRCKIAPWQIAEVDNPVVELAAPRADFQGALYQFLIGLLQTTFAPEDHQEWLKYWGCIPNPENVESAFKSISSAFGIDISVGPAFMQEVDDFGDSEDGKCPIEDLVGGDLSENTRKKNSDLFVKRGVIRQVSPYWAALALFNVQTSGVLAWGQHRIGLRKNGPLTTVLLPVGDNPSIWNKLWLNVIDKENGDLIPGDWSRQDLSHVFPWMGKTRLSPNKEKTIPIDANPLQHYWPTPRRVRLNFESVSGYCDLSGEEIEVGVKSFRRINNGVYYTDGWRHPLSPYSIVLDKAHFPSVVLADGISETFKDWPLAVTGYCDSSTKWQPALNIRIFDSYRSMDMQGVPVTVWCFGYRANNANVYGYVDGRLPYFHVAPEYMETFLAWVALLIDSAEKTKDIIYDAVCEAWYGVERDKKERNKRAISALKKHPTLGRELFEAMRQGFFASISLMVDQAAVSRQLNPRVASQWISELWNVQQRLFSMWSLDGEPDEKRYRQIVLAKNAMEKKFNGIKVIKDLKQIAAAKTEAA